MEIEVLVVNDVVGCVRMEGSRVFGEESGEVMRKCGWEDGERFGSYREYWILGRGNIFRDFWGSFLKMNFFKKIYRKIFIIF